MKEKNGLGAFPYGKITDFELDAVQKIMVLLLCVNSRERGVNNTINCNSGDSGGGDGCTGSLVTRIE